MPSDAERSIAVVRSLIGQELERVHYLFPAQTGLPPDGPATVHEVDHAVQLTTSAGSVVTLMWEMDGGCAALLAIPGTGFDAGITDLVEAYDVSGYATWRELIGQAITSAAIAWHHSDEDCPVTPWAVRFEVATGGCFVTALAEMRHGASTLEYMPNNLGVIFDRRIAKGFHVHGGESPAWGERIS